MSLFLNLPNELILYLSDYAINNNLRIANKRLLKVLGFRYFNKYRITYKDLNNIDKIFNRYNSLPKSINISLTSENNKIILHNHYLDQESLFSLVLNFRGNLLTSNDMEYISRFRFFTNLTYLSLNLSYNKGLLCVFDYGYIFGSLSELPILKTLELYLSHCNDLNNTFFLSELYELRNSKSITSLKLDLPYNKITSKGAKYLSEINNLVTLNLNLEANEIRNEGAKYLANFKDRNIKNLKLNILSNCLSYAGHEYLDTLLSGSFKKIELIKEKYYSLYPT